MLKHAVCNCKLMMKHNLH